MRRALSGILVVLLAAPGVAVAAERPGPLATTVQQSVTAVKAPGPLAAAATREGSRLAAASARRGREKAGQPSSSRPRGWLGRHPALFGALVGAGAGVVMGATMENELICSGGDEDCLIYGRKRLAAGAGIGAGIGSLVGLIAGAARKD